MVPPFIFKMKRIKIALFRVFSVVLLSIVVSYAYGAKVIDGSLGCMKGEKYITIKLDCSKQVYKKGRPFQEYLDKAQELVIGNRSL